MNEKYWKQFENSGKIEDYLTFLACARQENSETEKQSKEGMNAGIYHSDGNHIEAVSRGGVRQTYQPFD